MKTPRNRVMTAVLSIACTLSAAPARADTPAAGPTLTDRVIATQLFKEGRQLLQQGHVAEACPKLEESQRLEPGGGTLLNVALCHEKQGRNASAWVEFTEALGMAKQDGRVQRILFAQSHLNQLEPTLSRLTIVVPASPDGADLQIERDGNVVARAAWGSAIPVDPGLHSLQASAPGKATWRQSVQVGANADSKTVVVPALETAESPQSATVASAPSPSRPSLASENGHPHSTFGSAPKRAASAGPSVPGWLMLGVGAAALGAGTYFGIHAIEQKHESDRNCPDGNCTALGASKSRDAIHSGNWSTVSFGVGAVAAGIGLYLIVTKAPAPQLQEAKTRHRSVFGQVLQGLLIGPGEVRASGQF